MHLTAAPPWLVIFKSSIKCSSRRRKYFENANAHSSLPSSCRSVSPCIPLWNCLSIYTYIFRCGAHIRTYTGCSLNIVFFPYFFVIFLNSAIVLLQRWCSTSLCWGVHTLIPRENRERSESGFFKIFEKNTIFNEHPVVDRFVIMCP